MVDNISGREVLVSLKTLATEKGQTYYFLELKQIEVILYRIINNTNSLPVWELACSFIHEHEQYRNICLTHF
jgi:hypothetical protein